MLKCIRWLLIVFVTLIFGIAAGIFAERSRSMPPESDSPCDFARLAVQQAKNSPTKAEMLLRRAMAGMGQDPERCCYVWHAIEKAKTLQGNIPSVQNLPTEFLHELDLSLFQSKTPDDFNSLYNLRNEVEKVVADSPNHESGSMPSNKLIGQIPENRSRESSENMTDMFIKGLEEKDLERAEYLTQTVLKSQEVFPCIVPGLWKGYKSYLAKQQILPHERLSLFTAYLERVEVSLSTCRNQADFDAVWTVRSEILQEKSLAYDHLAHDASESLDKFISETTAQNCPDCLGVLAEEQKNLQPTLLLLAASVSQEKEVIKMEALSERTQKLVKHLLQKTQAEMRKIKELRDTEQKRDLAGEAVDPSESEPATIENSAISYKNSQLGMYESLIRQAGQFRNSLDEVDLFSWVKLVSGLQEGSANVKKISLANTNNSTKPPSAGVELPQNENTIKSSQNKADSLEKEFNDVYQDLDNLIADLSRLQVLRYNLWALRTIHRAENAANWSPYLGQIDVGLLHPTVNALYSSAYDPLIKTITEPHARIAVVQTILNTKKRTLSAF